MNGQIPPWMQGRQQQQWQNTPNQQWQQTPQQWQSQPQQHSPFASAPGYGQQLRPVPPGMEPPQVKTPVKASTKKKVVLYTLLGLMVISTVLFIITAVKYLSQ